MIGPTPEIYHYLSDKNQLVHWFKTMQQPFLLKTVLINPQEADALWNDRKNLVFKPAAAFGGKGVYLGKKLSKPKWDEIVAAGNYLAQEYVAPLEIEVSGLDEKVKIDFRAYAWREQLLLLVARGYTGQLTNFRSPGSGFYPIKRE